MRTLRRLQLVTWCLLLPLLGTALPHAALWRCTHATQAMLALPSPQAMPCAMPGQMPMPRMACCAAQKSSSHAALNTPPCKPALIPAAVAAPARVTPAQTLLSPAPLMSASAFAPFTANALPVPGQMALRLRGPPATALPAQHRCSPVGLRAPPIA